MDQLVKIFINNTTNERVRILINDIEYDNPIELHLSEDRSTINVKIFSDNKIIKQKFVNNFSRVYPFKGNRAENVFFDLLSWNNQINYIEFDIQVKQDENVNYVIMLSKKFCKNYIKTTDSYYSVDIIDDNTKQNLNNRIKLCSEMVSKKYYSCNKRNFIIQVIFRILLLNLIFAIFYINHAVDFELISLYFIITTIVLLLFVLRLKKLSEYVYNL